MAGYTDTALWQRTLAARPSDDATAARDRLRDSYLDLRDRAAQVAKRIAVDLPDFTVHDESHFDALWEMATVLVPDTMDVTPTEAFVLGGAFAIHDLGMGLAAFPAGLEELRARPLWRDSIALVIHRRAGYWPNAAELDTAGESELSAALQIVLRTLHAERAEWIATHPWMSDSGDPQYLIQNDDLRSTFGHLMGRLAHSHWWPAADLEAEFAATLGAPAWSSPQCPVSWTLDPLKLAAILRSADAIHLDARRAPRFLRTLRHPSDTSSHHWAFQEKLNRPIIERERVVFTSATPFPREEASAWWTCFDVLREVDQYLLEVDSVLASNGRQRLAARGVAALESPKHLAARVPTAGWQPVNTQVHVSDVARLVRHLGGEELYGRNAPVALRELLQNGCDAVRARRIVEARENGFGKVVVRLGNDEDGDWLEVEDNGIGMSTAVLTDVLLDFGRSYWESDLVARELPGLMGAGFSPVGQFGIGFFSVLMLGDRITITTRRYDAAQRSTQVLEFQQGVRDRPLLRPSEESEYLREGGTRIRVWLRVPPGEVDGLLWRFDEGPWPPEALIAWLAPAVAVDISFDNGLVARDVVAADDWRTLAPDELVRRIYVPDQASERRVDKLLTLAANMRDLNSCDGTLVGRAFIYPNSAARSWSSIGTAGVVTVGGLRASGLDSVAGTLEGLPERASRDVATPTVERDSLANWATEQGQLLASSLDDESSQAAAAATILLCWGSPGDLRVGDTAQGWLSLANIQKWATKLDEVVIISGGDVAKERERGSTIGLNANVVYIHNSYSLLEVASMDYYSEWPETELFGDPAEFRSEGEGFGEVPEWVWITRNSTIGAIVGVLSSAWQTEPRAILEASQFRFEASFLAEIAIRDGVPFKHPPQAILRRPSPR